MDSEKNTNKTIFVFYTMMNTGQWTYTKLPKGWRWIGSGSTSPVNAKKLLKYEREEQFAGPKETKKATIEYLDKIFKKLKKNNIIKIYKIRQSYLP